jgi:hypothetical protein
VRSCEQIEGDHIGRHRPLLRHAHEHAMNGNEWPHEIVFVDDHEPDPRHGCRGWGDYWAVFLHSNLAEEISANRSMELAS